MPRPQSGDLRARIREVTSLGRTRPSGTADGATFGSAGAPAAQEAWNWWTAVRSLRRAREDPRWSGPTSPLVPSSVQGPLVAVLIAAPTRAPRRRGSLPAIVIAVAPFVPDPPRLRNRRPVPPRA